MGRQQVRFFRINSYIFQIIDRILEKADYIQVIMYAVRAILFNNTIIMECPHDVAVLDYHLNRAVA